MTDDLLDIEIPRYVHKAGESARLVLTRDEYDAAVVEGWTLRPEPIADVPTRPAARPAPGQSDAAVRAPAFMRRPDRKAGRN